MRLQLRLAFICLAAFVCFAAVMGVSEGESTHQHASTKPTRAVSKIATNVTRPKSQKYCTSERLVSIRKRIHEYRERTYKSADVLGIKHHKYSRARIHNCGYANWVRLLWWSRVRKQDSYLYMIAKADRDFSTAGHLAEAVFGVSYDRLEKRAGKEGGHGKWVCNHQGSGACGHFQFMEGTYYSYSSSAFKIARQHSYPIPESYNKWTSLLGQTLTAAYMFDLGLECSHVGWAASC